MSRNQDRAFRNNSEATQPKPQPEAPVSAFNFIVPTEMIDLPSKGDFYPEGHPLYGVSSIEVKHMTAKEEDILTSSTFLKKGIALDKMLQSIIVNKQIKIEDFLIGDKNALLIASRVFGYGADYTTQIICPSCNLSFKTVFDLNSLENKELIQVEAITRTENNTFIITLLKSNIIVEFRLLTSKDESEMAANKSSGTMKLLKLITVSINEQTDKFYIEKALQSLPILDVSILKKAYASVMPDVDMTQNVECPDCGEASDMEIPLNAGFFWPNL